MFSEVLSVIWQAVIGLLLRLDGIVYDLICYFYEIFLFLAELDIFENADYYNIVKRIYIILGVIMLFVLTYSLLRAVINPDNFSKGENSFGNIIKNVVMSLVIIALLPTAFEIANRVQNVILNSDFIGKLILSENFTTGVVADGGRKMSSTVFQAFLRIDDNIGSADIEQDANLVTAAWQDAFNKVEQGQSFKLFAMDFDFNGETIFFPELIAKNAVSYTMVVSTLAGAFLLWTILLFCFDLGIRVIKLIYYQLIAPVAVICRVLPGKKTKPIFDNWLKYTLSTYAEVFIRIIIMYLGIYLITLIRDRMGNIFSAAGQSGLGVSQQVLAVAFLIMGVVAFIRQAPKLIQNVFGIESGGLNLGFKGLMERAGNGGFFAVANATGGLIAGHGIGGMIRGARYGLHNNNLHGIGVEAERRRLDQIAREHGATRGGIMLNHLRNMIGLDSDYDARNRRIDAQVKALEEQKEQAQEQWRQQRGKERMEGNSNYNELFEKAKSRAETLVLREDATNTTATFQFYGTDGKKYTIGGTNLYAFQKFLDEHSNIMTGAQIQSFGNYLRDQTKAEVKNIFDATSQSIVDHENNPSVDILDTELANAIMDMRQDHIINGTLMNENGVSALAANTARVADMNSSTNLFDTLDSLNKEVLDTQHTLGQTRSAVDASVAEIDRQIANAQASRSSNDMSRRRYEADVSNRHQNHGGGNNGGGNN